MGDRYLVATTDPITFATDEIGLVRAARQRQRPGRARRAAALVPRHRAPARGRARPRRASRRSSPSCAAACAELGVALVGGHTEVTAGLPRAIVSRLHAGRGRQGPAGDHGRRARGRRAAADQGRAARGRGHHRARARRRGAAPRRARRRGRARARASCAGRASAWCPRRALACARGARARDARPDRGRRGHGVLGDGPGRRRGACAWTASAFPVLREGRVLCEAFGLDPLGTIASGSLLLAVDAGGRRRASIAACRGAGIDCAAIGRVTPASEGVTLASGGHRAADARASPRTRSPRSSPEADPGKGDDAADRLRAPTGAHGPRRHGRLVSSARLAGRRRGAASPAATWWTRPSPPMRCSRVTQPNYCGVGGDLFCLYYEAATRRVHFLNGAGRSGSRATLDELARRGLDRVPTYGPASVSVPGVHARAGACCSSASARARSERCSSRPSTTRATGFPISRHRRARPSASARRADDDPEWHRVFVPGGEFPETGPVLPPARPRPHARPSWATSPSSSTAGGWRAPSPTAWPPTASSPRDDLAAHDGRVGRADLARPIAATRVYETPPPTQGLAALLTPEPARGLRPRAACPSTRVEHLHLLLEMTKLAYADRDRWVADPEHARAARRARCSTRRYAAQAAAAPSIPTRRSATSGASSTATPRASSWPTGAATS